MTAIGALAGHVTFPSHPPAAPPIRQKDQDGDSDKDRPAAPLTDPAQRLGGKLNLRV